MISKHLFVILFSITILNLSCSNKDETSLFPVKSDEKWGFIDSTGKLIIDYKYEMVGAFSDGLAIAYTENDTYGYIDKEGKFVIEPEFHFSSQIRIPLLYPLRTQFGSTLDDSIQSVIAESTFSNGYALYWDKATDRYGYINKKGEVVIKPRFYMASRFKNGCAVVCTHIDSDPRENRSGLINTSGELIIPDNYYYVTRPSGSYLNATSISGDTEVMYRSSLVLNKNNQIINTVLPNTSCLLDEFSKGYCKGKVDLYQVLYGKGYFIFDSTGNVLKDALTGNDLYFEDVVINNGKYFWVKIDGKYRWFILSKENIPVLIDGREYEDIRGGFNRDGIASVRYKIQGQSVSRFGYIDTSGQFILQPKYDNAAPFIGPLARAQLNNGPVTIKGYINKKGVFIWSKETKN